MRLVRVIGAVVATLAVEAMVVFGVGGVVQSLGASLVGQLLAVWLATALIAVIATVATWLAVDHVDQWVNVAPTVSSDTRSRTDEWIFANSDPPPGARPGEHRHDDLEM